MNSLKIIYTAEFIKDRVALLKKFPPKHSQVFGHHSTIAFKPSSLEGIVVGRESVMKVLGRVYDEKADALLVENPKSTNEYPHITLSCAPGIPPMYANELLKKSIESGTIEYFDPAEFIDVIEGYFDGEQDIVKK